MDALISQVENISLSSCTICKKTIYNNDICRECFLNYLEFNKMVKPNGISLDYEVEPLWASKNLKNVVFQGGMNPKFLLKTDDAIQKEAKKNIN